jgi:glycogen debranching enzyme
MAALAPVAGKDPAPWDEQAAAIARGFERFWNDDAGYCYDVLDGPDGDDPTLRPNQLLAVSLQPSPLAPAQCRAVVDTCARWLHTSFGPRSLDPRHPFYRGRYGGGSAERDGVYHQGTVWSWLLGPFALAHFHVYRDRAAALRLLEPMRHHLADYGLGSIAEIFEGDAPFEPRGCPAQAWSVAETLRAWCELEAPGPHARRRRAR